MQMDYDRLKQFLANLGLHMMAVFLFVIAVTVMALFIALLILVALILTQWAIQMIRIS
jgi:hypothetical protein